MPNNISVKSQYYLAITTITEIHLTTSKLATQKNALLSVNMVKTTDKKWQNLRYNSGKLEQKPCHIKTAHLSEWNIFLRTYIGAVHNKMTDK